MKLDEPTKSPLENGDGLAQETCPVGTLESVLYGHMAKDISAPAIFVTDPGNGYQLLHASATCRHFGNTLETLHGMPLPEYIPTLTSARLDKLWQEVCKYRTASMEADFCLASGSRIAVEIVFSLLEHDGRELMVGYMCDISAIRNTDRRMSHALSNLPGFVYTFRMSPDGHFSFPFVSRGIEDIYGLTPEDVRDDMAPLHGMAHPEDAPHIEAAIAESARTMLPFLVEVRVQRPDCPERWVESRSLPECEADGGILWIGVMLDITERKRAEEAMRESEEKLRDLYALSPLGIALTDMNGHYLEFNEAFSAICGYPIDELNGLDYWTLTPQEYAHQEAEQLESLSRTGRYGPYEKEYRRKDGKHISIRLNGTLIVGKDGQNYIWSIVEDISERKQVEALLNERLAHISELNLHLEENARTLEEQAVEFEAQAVELEASQEQSKMTEAWYRGIVRSAPDGMVVVNERGLISLVNEQFEKMFGYTEVELIGNSMEILLPPHARQEHVAKREGFFASGEMGRPMGAIGNGLRVCRKDGTEFPVDVSLSRLPDADGRAGIICAVIRDVSERKRMEDTLATREREFRTLVENLPTYVVRIDQDMRRIYVNPAYVVSVGIPEAELLGSHTREFWRATNMSADAYIMLLKRVLLLGEQREVSLEWLDSDGRLVSHIVRIEPEYGQDDEVQSLLVLGFDVSDSRYQQILEVERQRVFEKMAHGGDLNEILEQVILYVEASSSNRRCRILLLNEELNCLYSAAAPSFSVPCRASLDGIAVREDSSSCGVAAWRGERGGVEDLRHHDSPESCQEFACENRVAASWSEPIVGPSGEVLGVVVIYLNQADEPGEEDRTLLQQASHLSSIAIERKRIEELMHHQASYDSLTGLPNRRLFGDRLREEIAKAERGNYRLALLFIDLDRFKEVNDTLGHMAGDGLLVEAVQRIRACVRESDIVARLAGDEFVVILPEVGEIAPQDRVAQSIVESMAQSFQIGDHKAYVSASVGIAGYPQDADNAEALIGCADQAMYAAKEAGRNNFSFFTRHMLEQAQQRLYLTDDLREALGKGQLEVYYQPIIDVASGKAVKAEALLRWHHPLHGMVPPDQFIPIAEETDLIHEIGAWVFREAAAIAKRWNAMSEEEGTRQISVNVSPRQFVRGNPDVFCIEHLRAIGLNPNAVVVEITEGLLLDDHADVMNKLRRFHQEGMQLALDDFGTGYSAMAYLKKFNIDYLKIDRSFVRDLETDPGDRAIAEAIVVMAHCLGLKVIAEGVETEGQCALLAAVGCEYVQGYLYARPMPVGAFLEYVEGNAVDLIPPSP